MKQQYELVAPLDARGLCGAGPAEMAWRAGTSLLPKLSIREQSAPARHGVGWGTQPRYSLGTTYTRGSPQHCRPPQSSPQAGLTPLTAPMHLLHRSPSTPWSLEQLQTFRTVAVQQGTQGKPLPPSAPEERKAASGSRGHKGSRGDSGDVHSGKTGEERCPALQMLR